MRRLFILLASSAAVLSPQARDEPATFKASVHIVTVPVVVRDAHGHAAGNLRQEDFQLSDNGKAQVISKFSVTQSDGAAASQRPAAQPIPPPPSAMPDRFVAYLIDDLHMAAGDLMGVRTAVARHLRSDVRPGDRSAIFTSSGQGGSGFTNDQDKLQSALARLMPRPMSAARTGCPNIGYYEADLIANRRDSMAIQAAVREMLTCSPMSETEESATPLVMGQARHVLLEGEQETRVGLSALLDVVKRMAAAPGQRTIVLISPGFLKPDLQREMSAIVQMAIRANVVISALDARGLWTDPGLDASSRMSGGATQIKSSYARAAASAATNAMSELAAAAGGRFITNSNDLAGGLRETTTAPQYAYLLGFSPPDLKLDGKYHTLKVALKGVKGMSIEARRGYFAPNSFVDPASQAKQEIQEAVYSREERNDLATELFAKVTPTRDATGVKTEARIATYTRLDLRNLELRKTGGRNRNAIRIVSALFDSNGSLITGKEQLFNLNLSDNELEKARAAGITARTDFEVKPGTYVVRSIVRTEEGRITARNNAI
jgi:VWFA-related protein